MNRIKVQLISFEVVLLVMVLWSALGFAQSRSIILSTTTSTQDSGLLDVLIPLFEKQSGYSVKTVAVGTGQALALAGRGDGDVVLAHAPSLEKEFVTQGKLLNRHLVMYNDFIIVGRKKDTAKIRTMKSAATALRAIEQAKATFVSRGDKSGTHNVELGLWKFAGVAPIAPWYIESGQGMGATLGIARERNGYVLTDRATYLALSKNLGLPILVQGDRVLLNIYSVLEVNPANGPRVNVAGGKAFADFMVSKKVQEIIGKFGVDKFGAPLFFPDAGAEIADLDADFKFTAFSVSFQILRQADITLRIRRMFEQLTEVIAIALGRLDLRRIFDRKEARFIAVDMHLPGCSKWDDDVIAFAEFEIAELRFQHTTAFMHPPGFIGLRVAIEIVHAFAGMCHSENHVLVCEKRNAC
jgi:tungstate transport system substrate-binding protein